MNFLVWVMMGIAIWHFAVFVPDRFWGGIVGAFGAAVVGAVVIGLLVQGFRAATSTTPTSAPPWRRSRAPLLGLAVGYGSSACAPRRDQKPQRLSRRRRSVRPPFLASAGGRSGRTRAGVRIPMPTRRPMRSRSSLA